jgi:hypothetical protein
MTSPRPGGWLKVDQRNDAFGTRENRRDDLSPAVIQEASHGVQFGLVYCIVPARLQRFLSLLTARRRNRMEPKRPVSHVQRAQASPEAPLLLSFGYLALRQVLQLLAGRAGAAADL